MADYISNPSLDAPVVSISTTGRAGRALELSGPTFVLPDDSYASLLEGRLVQARDTEPLDRSRLDYTTDADSWTLA